MSNIEFVYFQDEWNTEKSRDDWDGEVQPERTESIDSPEDDTKRSW